MREVAIPVDPVQVVVSGLFLRPERARALYVFAHGAGAGMRHAFMADFADALAAREIATLRYQFPYMETGGGRPDTPVVAAATVQSAVQVANELAPDLPLFAGGKSFGGRMTSTAASRAQLARVDGLVFVGFPLHPPRRPAITRAEHLDLVNVPMLFLQGTRDDLADLTLIREVVARLGPLATMVEVDQANHAFEVPKRTGRTRADVLGGLAENVADWVAAIG
ncbi:MAG: alpha/beta family hydrolase [Gemmatimonadales bacterium]